MVNKDNNLSYLKSLVRQRDMDRYLTILLCSSASQPALFSLAALNVELANIPEMVKEPGLSAIRYQWWRDAFEDRKAISGNPVVDSVNVAAQEYNLPTAHMIQLIDRYEEFEYTPSDGDDAKLLAVDAPLYELMALVLGGQPSGILTRAAEAAALSMAAAKFTGHEGLGRANARECAGQLEKLDPKIFDAVFDAFLPVSLIELYLKGDAEDPGRQLRRLWTLWRAHRKRRLFKE